MRVVIWLLDRLVPTLLMGASAALLAAGVLSYAPSAFGEWQTPAPIAGGDPRFESPSPGSSGLETAWPSGGPSFAPSDWPSDGPTAPITLPPGTLAPGTTPSPVPSDMPTGQPPTGGPTQPPSGGPTSDPTAGPGNGPTPQPTPRSSGTPPPTTAPGSHGFATRIVIPSLDIDLPVVPSDLVVPGNEGFYPLCDVAIYMVGFVQPGQAGTTYIYGHAQDGMFAPLLRASRYNNGASMIGALVEVYTSDNMLHMYEITLVKRHATDLSITRVPPGVHQLVLQTSEGWSGHVQKLQIAARPLAVLPASAREANPVPHPRVCLPH